MACEPNVSTGKLWKLEYIIDCLDTAPVEDDWVRFGGLVDKTINSDGNLIDVTTDTTVGDFIEQIMTTKTLDITGNGIVKNTGEDSDSLLALYMHYMKPTATGGQPLAWIRITSPLITWVIPAVFSSFNMNAPLNEAPTFDFALTQTASPIGSTIERTPTV